MRRNLYIQVILCAMLGLPVYATGGTCPSGANYTNPTNPLGATVALSTFGVTSCYFISAAGSDSLYDGTTEAISGSHGPFLHSPGMNNCASNCAGVTLASGIGVVFRGGDTWHFGNSGATPYGGVVSTCADNGNDAAGLCLDDISATSGNQIYYGVDKTWFTGGSWARPIFTADNPLCNAGTANGTTCISNPSNSCLPSAGGACTGLFYVNACTYPNIGNTNNLIDIGFSAYIIFDNFELTGICQNDLGQPTGHDDFVNYGADQGPIVLTNLYIHGWSHTQFGSPNGQTPCHATPLSCVNTEALHGNVTAAETGGVGESILLNVVDGADSDPVGGWIGFPGFYNTAYNVFRYNSGSAPGTIAFFHDNLFEFMYGNGHSNVIESAERVTNAAIYNNVCRHIELAPYGDGGVVYWFGPVATTTTDYIFNNLCYDVGPAEYLDIGAVGLTTNQGVYKFFNNTWQTTTSQTILNCDAQSTGTTADVNNHYIDDQNYIQTTGSCGNTTSTTVLWQSNTSGGSAPTYSDANTSPHFDQYTSSETYAYSPVASTNSTVGAGTNETSGYCNTLSGAGLSAAATACQSDTTYACSYSGNGATPICPARTVNSRPSTWDIGAYQFQTAAVMSCVGCKLLNSVIQ